ncbi:MAG: hypothetical protein F2560_01800, partial [Actinobacteria bacterium]|nr:hypothetical protein [Actinomycetota bacterium]
MAAVLRDTADGDNVAMTSVEQVHRRFFVFLLGIVWAIGLWTSSVAAGTDGG